MTVDLNKLTALAGQVRDRAQQHAPAARKPWRITAAADSTTVYIYDDIGADPWGDGINAADFATELDAVTTPTINIRLNSSGGQVFAGVAMYEAIKRHPAHTEGWVDGVAASAASMIAMACDTLNMAKTGRLMIHDAGIGGILIQGNAAQLRASVDEVEAFADLLDSLSDTIAGVYADKAGGTPEAWRALMASDRWYTADQAVAAGLADRVTGADAPTNSAPAPVADTPIPPTFDVEGLRNTLKGVFA